MGKEKTRHGNAVKMNHESAKESGGGVINSTASTQMAEHTATKGLKDIVLEVKYLQRKGAS